MPQPAKKISKLIDKMNMISRRAFKGEGSPVTEMELARLKIEAKQLPDEIEKNLLLGMISAIKFSLPDV
ncbi:MAG: hypothetical protein OQK32_07880, partial [Gammaproteobacteria bacterium]|nr:hypothetical protein [Gammaproteobacteria bacterium]